MSEESDGPPASSQSANGDAFSDAKRPSLTKFFAQSPLAGTDIIIERNRSESRPIDL